jgi:hypothetical protein
MVPFAPTEPFRFCPADGARLEKPLPSGGVTCPLCGRSWYRNSAPAVGAVIVEDGRALVTARAREPEKGRLDLPGGFLGVGEHPVDGLAREELGVEIEVFEPPILRQPIPTGRTDGTYSQSVLGRESSRANRTQQTTWRRLSGSPRRNWTPRTSPGNTTRGWSGKLSAARSLPVLAAGMSLPHGRRSQRPALARDFGFCQ